MQQYLPKDSIEFFTALGNQVDNFGLLTFKAAWFDDKYKAWYMKEVGNNKEKVLCHKFPKSAKINLLLKDIAERQVAQLSNLESQKFKIGTISDLKVQHRLVVGLGTESVYETSMTLHPVYGIPYLPASAIKGVLRNYVINELYRLETDEESFKGDKRKELGKELERRALQDPIFCQIFGCPKESIADKALKGRVLFFDAFPKGEIMIEADVMTPHYQKYYMDDKNKTPPADWLEPNPIVFITVREPVFDFHFAVRDVSTEDGTIWKTLNELVTSKAHPRFIGKTLGQLFNDWLPEALRMNGIGAKTAVGYGVFDEVTLKK